GQERVVDRVHAHAVLRLIDDAARAPDGVARLLVQRHLERLNERVDQVEEHPLGVGHGAAHFLVDQRAEHDRAGIARARHLADLLRHRTGFVERVHEPAYVLLELDAVELGEQAQAQGFGGDARAVGHEKDVAFHRPIVPETPLRLLSRAWMPAGGSGTALTGRSGTRAMGCSNAKPWAGTTSRASAARTPRSAR